MKTGNLIDSSFVINPDFVNGDLPGTVMVSIKTNLSQMQSNLLKMQDDLKSSIDNLVANNDINLEKKVNILDLLLQNYNEMLDY